MAPSIWSSRPIAHDHSPPRRRLGVKRRIAASRGCSAIAAANAMTASSYWRAHDAADFTPDPVPKHGNIRTGLRIRALANLSDSAAIFSQPGLWQPVFRSVVAHLAPCHLTQSPSHLALSPSHLALSKAGD